MSSPAMSLFSSYAIHGSVVEEEARPQACQSSPADPAYSRDLLDAVKRPRRDDARAELGADAVERGQFLDGGAIDVDGRGPRRQPIGRHATAALAIAGAKSAGDTRHSAPGALDGNVAARGRPGATEDSARTQRMGSEREGEEDQTADEKRAHEPIIGARE